MRLELKSNITFTTYLTHQLPSICRFPDRCANVHIPTKAGVLKLKPQKLSEVKREVLKQLDSTTLNQIKTLNSNLHMIVDMANKLGKL